MPLCISIFHEIYYYIFLSLYTTACLFTYRILELFSGDDRACEFFKISFYNGNKNTFSREIFEPGPLLLYVYFSVSNNWTTTNNKNYSFFTHFVTCLRKNERNIWQLVGILSLRVLFEMRHQFLTVISSMWNIYLFSIFFLVAIELFNIRFYLRCPSNYLHLLVVKGLVNYSKYWWTFNNF